MSLTDRLVAEALFKSDNKPDLNAYLLKKLIKKLEGKPEDTKKKEEDKKKHNEWKFEERLLLGIFIASTAPLIGAAYYALFQIAAHAH